MPRNPHLEALSLHLHTRSVDWDISFIALSRQLLVAAASGLAPLCPALRQVQVGLDELLHTWRSDGHMSSVRDFASLREYKGCPVLKHR